MHCLPQGMTEFLPVNFQDHYFSILNCYIQSVLLDYRFRTKSYQQIQQEYFGNANDAKKDSKNGAADTKKGKKNEGKKGKGDDKSANFKKDKAEEEFKPETIA